MSPRVRTRIGLPGFSRFQALWEQSLADPQTFPDVSRGMIVTRFRTQLRVAAEASIRVIATMHQLRPWNRGDQAGRPVRMLTLIDEFTREGLAIDVAHRMTSEDVLERLSDLLIQRGPPEYIRSNNGPDFTVHRARD